MLFKKWMDFSKFFTTTMKTSKTSYKKKSFFHWSKKRWFMHHTPLITDTVELSDKELFGLPNIVP